MKKHLKFNNGFVMVEIIVAIAIITASVLACMALSQKAISMTRQSLHQTQSAFLMEEGAEALRIIRDNSWAGISALNINTNYYLSFSGGTWTLSTTPSQIGIFTRQITLSSVYRDINQDIASSGTLDTQIRLVTVTMSWQEGGQTITKNLQFYISDIFS